MTDHHRPAQPTMDEFLAALHARAWAVTDAVSEEKRTADDLFALLGRARPDDGCRYFTQDGRVWRLCPDGVLERRTPTGDWVVSTRPLDLVLAHAREIPAIDVPAVRPGAQLVESARIAARGHRSGTGTEQVVVSAVLFRAARMLGDTLLGEGHIAGQADGVLAAIDALTKWALEASTQDRPPREEVSRHA